MSDQMDKQKPIDKKRRAVARAGVASPLIMSLMNKTALGQGVYHCSISGAQSGNQSSHPDISTNCYVGYSPAQWCQNADKLNDGNNGGNIDDWLQAGETPFDTRRDSSSSDGDNDNSSESSSGTSSNSEEVEKGAGNWVSDHNIFKKIHDHYSSDANLATRFDDVFSNGGSTRTLWEVLCNGSSFEQSVAADYLNAKLHEKDGRFSPVYDVIHSDDIIRLYQNSDNNGYVVTSFVTVSGYQVPVGFNAASYLANIHQ